MTDYPEPDRDVLAAGIEWLYRTVQPEGAIIQHHGTNIGCAANRYYGFCPAGAMNLPVVTLNVTKWRWDDSGPEARISGVLADGEMAANAEALRALGAGVREQWNGDGGISGSFGLVEPAHPSLLAAVANYRARCPEHKSPFCGHSPERGGHGCPWYRNGNRLVIEPRRPVRESAKEI